MKLRIPAGTAGRRKAAPLPDQHPHSPPPHDYFHNIMAQYYVPSTTHATHDTECKYVFPLFLSRPRLQPACIAYALMVVGLPLCRDITHTLIVPPRTVVAANCTRCSL